MRRLFLISALVLVFIAPAWGANVNYYLDSNAAGGGDGSETTPWNSLASLGSTQWNALNAAATAGDQANIWLKCNSVFNAQFYPYNSGVSGHPIVVSSYGYGNPPQIKRTTSGNVIYATSLSYITFNNIKFGPPTSGDICDYAGTCTGWIFNKCIFDGGADLSSTTSTLFYTPGTNTITFNYPTFLRAGRIISVGSTTSTININNGEIYATYEPFHMSAAGSLTYTNCHIITSQTTALSGTDGGGNIISGWPKVVNPYRYGPPRVNISIDDMGPYTSGTGYDFVVSLISEMASRGNYKPTLNVIAGIYNAWTYLKSLHDSGYEICSHSWSHQYSGLGLANIRYVGAGTTCTMTISGKHLITTVDGVQDLNIDLTAPADPVTDAGLYFCIGGGVWGNRFVATIDALANYTCTAHANAQQATMMETAADVTDVDIKTGTYAILADQERLFKSQLTVSKAVLAAQLTGGAGGTWDNPVYVVPGGDYPSGSEAWILAEYQMGRAAVEVYASSLVAGVDLSTIPAIIPSSLTDAVLRTYILGKLTNAAMGGRVVVFFGHASNLTPHQWGVVLDAIIESGAIYSSLRDINTYLRTQTVVGRVVTGTTELSLDLHPRPNAATINTGTPVAGITQDIEGKARNQGGAPDIGPYEYNSSGAWFGM